MATEKEDVSHLEQAKEDSPATSTRNTGEGLDDDPVYTYKQQRKIIHRVDIRLITVAGIIYMNSLMDRSNLPNAGIAGMRTDLEMVNSRYVGCIYVRTLKQTVVLMSSLQSIVALVFFITYTFLQPPATLLTRKFGPRLFLSSICFAWGVVMVGRSHETG